MESNCTYNNADAIVNNGMGGSYPPRDLASLAPLPMAKLHIIYKMYKKSPHKLSLQGLFWAIFALKVAQN